MNQTSAWKLDLAADGIAWLTFDKPNSSANTLSADVLCELEEQLRDLSGQQVQGLVIRSGKASGFIAGADIREFTTFASEAAALEHIRLGQRVCAAARSTAVPDGRCPAWLRARRWARARAGLPLPHRRRGLEAIARIARGAAGHPSGLWRHGAQRPAARRQRRHAADAHRPSVAGRSGAQGGSARSGGRQPWRARRGAPDS